MLGTHTAFWQLFTPGFFFICITQTFLSSTKYEKFHLLCPKDKSSWLNNLWLLAEIHNLMKHNYILVTLLIICNALWTIHHLPFTLPFTKHTAPSNWILTKFPLAFLILFCRDFSASDIPFFLTTVWLLVTRIFPVCLFQISQILKQNSTKLLTPLPNFQSVFLTTPEVP